MNLKRILIEESEKNRILGMHSKHKSLITEAQNKPQLFPSCVRWAGDHVDLPQIGGFTGSAVHVPNAGGKGKDYYWSQETPKGRVMVEVDATTKEIRQVRSYNCICTNGKCSPKTYLDKLYTKEHECSDKKPCSQGGQTGGGQTGGQKDPNCKNKTPYNAFTDAGLNWKEESRKWIEAKCNGTTPCISGNASTNINLRNAFCDGTWGSKNGQDDGKQPEGCKTKCAAKPLQPGQTGQQVMGWFYSRDGVCYQDTGVGGFSSKAECEACKCGSSQQDGNNGNDSWSKYPCVLKRIKDNTLTKSKDFTICGCYQLTETCVIFSDGTAWCETPTGKGDLYYYQCFVDEIRIIKEKPIQVGVDRPNKPIKGGDELPDFIPPVIEPIKKSFD